MRGARTNVTNTRCLQNKVLDFLRNSQLGAFNFEIYSYFSTLKMSVESITTISPTTNQPVCTRPGITASDLQQLPGAASEAFLSFRKTSLAERQAIVKKALKLLSDKQDVLAKELTEQIGRPIAYTGVEIATAVKRGEYLLKISGDALKDTDGEPEKGFKRFIRKVPVGPVLILFAWNVCFNDLHLQIRLHS